MHDICTPSSLQSTPLLNDDESDDGDDSGGQLLGSVIRWVSSWFSKLKSMDAKPSVKSFDRYMGVGVGVGAPVVVALCVWPAHPYCMPCRSLLLCTCLEHGTAAVYRDVTFVSCGERSPLGLRGGGGYGHVSLTSFSLCCRVLTCLLCPSATRAAIPRVVLGCLASPILPWALSSSTADFDRHPSCLTSCPTWQPRERNERSVRAVQCTVCTVWCMLFYGHAIFSSNHSGLQTPLSCKHK